VATFFDNFDVRQIEDIELLAKQVVEGFIIGLHKSPFHGFSVEFAEHRLYNPGESTKDIDWKVYARTDKMFSKKYEEETNLRCHIIIDTSSSMYFPIHSDEHKLNKLQFSSLAAASLMNLFRKQRDAFGLSLFDNSVHLHTKSRSSTSHYRLLLSYLDSLIKDTTTYKKTSTAAALDQLAENIHRRSLVVIFSDMFDHHTEHQDIFNALQHLKYAKHEVILFHVTDKKHELDFEYENRPYIFIDVETNQEVKLQYNQVKDLYKTKIKKYKDDIMLKCLQYNIDYVDADIHEGFVPVLQKYLNKRSKLL